MKRLLPILAGLLLLPVLMKAQVSITVDPGSFVITGHPSQTDIAAHILVTNTASSPVNLFWSKRMNGGPANWLSWICDKNLCFDPGVNSCPANKPNQLNPGESFDLQVHMNPGNTEGSATYDLNVIDDQGNVIATVAGEINISSTTSVKEAGDSRLTVFPNPTQDFFQVSDTPGLRYIEVFNIVGNKTKSFDAAPQRQYFVGELPEGIYLVRLIASSGKVIKTVRLSKR